MEPEILLEFRIEYEVTGYGTQHFWFSRPSQAEAMKRLEDFWQMALITPYWTSRTSGRTIPSKVTSATLYMLVTNTVTMQKLKYPVVTRTRHEIDDTPLPEEVA